jgi:hypothetical protein
MESYKGKRPDALEARRAVTQRKEQHQCITKSRSATKPSFRS